MQRLLLQNRQLEKIKDIDHDLLEELIRFLRPIRKCSQTLSGDKYPTIHLVAICFSELCDEIQSFEATSDDMLRLQEQAKICLKDYVVTEDIHYMTCILDPR